MGKHYVNYIGIGGSVFNMVKYRYINLDKTRERIKNERIRKDVEWYKKRPDCADGSDNWALAMKELENEEKIRNQWQALYNRMTGE